MLSFNSVLVFSENPKKLAEFYKNVFEKDAEWAEGEYAGWNVGSGHIIVGPHSKVKRKSKNPERIIINFETKEVEKEFKRIKELGAKVVAEPYHPPSIFSFCPLSIFFKNVFIKFCEFFWI